MLFPCEIAGYSRRVLIGLLVLGAIYSAANAAAPSLESIAPQGVQRGAESALVLNGARLDRASGLLFYSPGITATELQGVDETQVKVKLRVEPDCRLGEHALRLVTATGVSELRTFQVGNYPPLDEQEPNNDAAQSQRVPLNVTISGVVDNADIDGFRVEARKGDRISAEVEAVRLGGVMFDARLAILDSSGAELSAADDTALLLQDSFVSVIAPADSDYVVQIRESAFEGSDESKYRLHIGSFPRPTAVFPPGGMAGEEVEVKFLGDARGEIMQRIKLPKSPLGESALFAEDAGQIAPSPNRFRISPFSNVLESEPNDQAEQGTLVKQSLPAALNGIISGNNDVDCFLITARRGDVFDVEVFARRLRSPLDPVLKILDQRDQVVAENDDFGNHDSRVRFIAPADGQYVVQIADHLHQGGQDYIYRIEFLPVQPELSLYIPAVAKNSQERQTVAVPRGNRYCSLMAASRTNFEGPVEIDIPGLPTGVKIDRPQMEANFHVVPVVFEATADAPLGGQLTDVICRHPDQGVEINGGFKQLVSLVLGPPGGAIYHQTSVDKLAVSVTAEAPFRLSIVQPQVPVVQDGLLQLKVVCERAAGFTDAIELSIPLLPPWLESSPTVTLPENANEVIYPVTAFTDAQTRSWPVVVIGQAEVGGGPVYTSTQLARIDVAPPMVTMQIEPSAALLGESTQLVCKLHAQQPFSGSAKLRIAGLPADVNCPEVDVTAETKEVVIPLTTAKTTPPGYHNTLFGELQIVAQGEVITHYVARGTVLQVDSPTTAAERLRQSTRLETLRKEQAARTPTPKTEN